MTIPFIVPSDYVILPTSYCTGRSSSKFLIELRDNQRIMGLKCPKCNIVYVPPKSVCSKCFSQLDEWVEVSDEGTLETFTVESIIYSHLYQPKEAPYAIGIIKLDGATTGLCHFLSETDPAKIKIGSRWKAVFKEKREASILDIDYFKLIS